MLSYNSSTLYLWFEPHTPLFPALLSTYLVVALELIRPACLMYGFWRSFQYLRKNYSSFSLSPYVGRLPCRIGHSSPYCRDHSYLSLPYWDEYLWCIHIIIIFKLNLTLPFQLYSVRMAMVHIDLLCLLYFYLKLAYLLELLGAFLVCGDFNISIDCGIQHSRCALDNLSPASSHIHRLSLYQPSYWQSSSLASHFKPASSIWRSNLAVMLAIESALKDSESRVGTVP